MRVALSGNRLWVNTRGVCRFSGDAAVTEGQKALCPMPQGIGNKRL